MFYQIFLSPQVKRSVIITNKLVCKSCLTSCRIALRVAERLSYEIGEVQNNVKTSWNL